MTSKKLGLRTESSARYEKGIDPNLCEKAADRVCRLIELLGCGKVLTGAVDVYPDKAEALPVSARVSRINKVLGTELSREEMERYLTGLEMKVDGKGDEMLVTPPTVRLDLLEEVDFVEEVARMIASQDAQTSFSSAAIVRFPCPRRRQAARWRSLQTRLTSSTYVWGFWGTK